MGILTVGVVTTPFGFEGKRRMAQAEEGINELSQHVDSLIVIPNENLKSVTKEKLLSSTHLKSQTMFFSKLFSLFQTLLMQQVL